METESQLSNLDDDVKPFEINHDDSLVKNGESEPDHSQSANPVVWISLSILIAVIFAIGNITISNVAHYGFKGRFLQGPGNIIGNSTPLIIISLMERFRFTKFSKAQNSIIPSTKKSLENNTTSYLNWFRELYLIVKIDSNGAMVSKTNWKRVFATILLAGVDGISIIIFFQSYYYATLIGLNNGIIMAVYSMKPIYTSIMFFIFFKQRLLWFEFIGIILGLIGAILIGISVDSSTLASTDESTSMSTEVIIALCLICLNICLILLSSRSVIVKYFVATKNNKGNISAFFNFSILVCDGTSLLVLFYLMLTGFDFNILELIITSSGGILSSAGGYLIAYVNIRGRAGASDALIETGVIYQTILDALIFGRFPNSLQVFSIIIGFSATILILWGHTK